jgi:dihydroneopterin aldolase
MRLWGRHGADPGERDRSQPIDVDVELTCDLSRAATTDDLADTVDYAAVYRLCEQVVSERSCVLLEALAGHIIAAIMRDGRIVDVTVRVRKPRLLEGATPEVELSSSRAQQ